VQQLLGSMETRLLDDYQQARVDLLRSRVAFALGFGDDVPTLMLRAAQRLEPFDLDLSRQTYLAAWGAASVAAGGRREGGLIVDVSMAVLDLPRSTGDRSALELLLEGLALLPTQGYAAAVPILKRAAVELVHIPMEDVLHWGWMAEAASNAVWDNDGAHAITARQVQLLRESGALANL